VEQLRRKWQERYGKSRKLEQNRDLNEKDKSLFGLNIDAEYQIKRNLRVLLSSSTGSQQNGRRSNRGEGHWNVKRKSKPDLDETGNKGESNRTSSDFRFWIVGRNFKTVKKVAIKHELPTIKEKEQKTSFECRVKEAEYEEMRAGIEKRGQFEH
jgi:hypothetical protein